MMMRRLLHKKSIEYISFHYELFVDHNDAGLASLPTVDKRTQRVDVSKLATLFVEVGLFFRRSS